MTDILTLNLTDVSDDLLAELRDAAVTEYGRRIIDAEKERRHVTPAAFILSPSSSAYLAKNVRNTEYGFEAENFWTVTPNDIDLAHDGYGSGAWPSDAQVIPVSTALLPS